MTTDTACWWLLHVDLTGSKLGPAWRSVDLQLDPVDWPAERIRQEAAEHYAVPLEQVGEPQFFREPHIPDPPPFDSFMDDTRPVVGYCSKCGDVREDFYTCRDGGHTVSKGEADDG